MTVDAIREFSRFYTRTVGALEDGYLHSSYSLAEARVLFELGQRAETDTAELRQGLGLDPGYMSRLLSRLESDGLVVRTRSRTDARRQSLTLTPAGRAAYEVLDKASSDDVERLLARLDRTDRDELVASLRTIQQILGDRQPPGTVVIRPPRAGDLGWIVEAHGRLYAEEYGYNASFEALVARIVADFADSDDHLRQAGWIAEVDGRRAGCILCTRADDTTAQLRTLLVTPQARGLGLGSRLVDECLRFARQAGYLRMKLWTNDILDGARRLYVRAGFTLDEQAPENNFGKQLVGQIWSRNL